MNRVEPRVLKGFRDYLPARMVPRQEMLATIEAIFQRFGYVPLMTPALEYLDVLTGKYGGEGEGLLYRFQDLGGRDVALRYDLTVPLARVVAQYPAEITLPFRRYQIAPVWRAENPARGRFREFVQCDADIVGSADMLADAEVLQVACACLRGLAIEKFRVRVNNRKVLAGLMAAAGVAPAAEAAVLRTIDKLDKIGREETARLLREENGLGDEPVRRIEEFLAVGGGHAGVLDRLRGLLGGEGPGRRGVEELAAVFAVLEGVGLADAVEIDLSIARGLAYYTGTIYEVFLGDLPGFGAVMAGGRYDDLIGVFKGESIPAVGISLGIDRLLEGLVELKVLKERRSVARILVTVFDAATAPYAARAAARIRSAGFACELFPAPAKIPKQIRSAERSGQRWLVIAGPDEARNNCVAVKDLEARTQETVPLDQLGDYFARTCR